jgi:hypothetical protein
MGQIYEGATETPFLARTRGREQWADMDFHWKIGVCEGSSTRQEGNSIFLMNGRHALRVSSF